MLLLSECNIKSGALRRLSRPLNRLVKDSRGALRLLPLNPSKNVIIAGFYSHHRRPMIPSTCIAFPKGARSLTKGC
jgi:hypothetical protein